MATSLYSVSPTITLYKQDQTLTLVIPINPADMTKVRVWSLKVTADHSPQDHAFGVEPRAEIVSVVTSALMEERVTIKNRSVYHGGGLYSVSTLYLAVID